MEEKCVWKRQGHGQMNSCNTFSLWTNRIPFSR